MQLKLVKYYKRRDKHYFVIDVKSAIDMSGPGLRVRTNGLSDLDGMPTGIVIAGAVEIDSLVAGRKCRVKLVIDASEVEAGEYLLALGLVKEHKRWYAHITQQILVK